MSDILTEASAMAAAAAKSARARLITPLALAHLTGTSVKDVETPRTLMRRASTPLMPDGGGGGGGISYSPAPPRAVTPTYRSPRMDSGGSSTARAHTPQPTSADALSHSQSMRGSTSQRVLFVSGSQTQPITFSPRLERIGSAGGGASSSITNTPAAATAVGAGASPRVSRRDSIGGQALNKKPVLVRRIRDPLVERGDDSKCDLYYVPTNRMSAEHRQILMLAAPGEKKRGIDAFVDVEEVQLLRERASYLLRHRSTATLDGGGNMFSGIIDAAARYAEFEQPPGWQPPADETKYDVITVVAPSGICSMDHLVKQSMAALKTADRLVRQRSNTSAATARKRSDSNND